MEWKYGYANDDMKLPGVTDVDQSKTQHKRCPLMKLWVLLPDGHLPLAITSTGVAVLNPSFVVSHSKDINKPMWNWKIGHYPCEIMSKCTVKRILRKFIANIDHTAIASSLKYSSLDNTIDYRMVQNDVYLVPYTYVHTHCCSRVGCQGTQGLGSILLHSLLRHQPLLDISLLLLMPGLHVRKQEVADLRYIWACHGDGRSCHGTCPRTAFLLTETSQVVQVSPCARWHALWHAPWYAPLSGNQKPVYASIKSQDWYFH